LKLCFETLGYLCCDLNLIPQHLAFSTEQRTRAFERLGDLLSKWSEDEATIAPFYDEIRESMAKSSASNSWFTPANTRLAMQNLGRMLEAGKLIQWVRNYNIIEHKDNLTPTVGVIMAGNIPAVGFHDLFCVLIAGNKAVVKLSSGDPYLIPAIVSVLQKIEPGFLSFISFEAAELKSADAIIATGSDNTARYFEYHYGSKPHIFRKNRYSIAVLSGEESGTELCSLADDVLSFFGLGCRNVTKIYIPLGYKFDALLGAFENYESLKRHQAYMNNYFLQRAVLTLNRAEFYDNGFLILKQSQAISSGIAVLNFEYYDHLKGVEDIIAVNHNKIQCIVSKLELSIKTTRFGETQQPALGDYADGVDTMEFLLNLKKSTR